MSSNSYHLPIEFNCLPKDVHHIHILGICGTGMAALAGMLSQRGYHITGSDSNVYPPMSDFLESQNISILNGYSEANLNPLPDLVIIGNVIRRDNPEALAVAENKLNYLSFPQALAHFFIQGKVSFVVTGTHGKTTTCSLLASSLFHCDLDPSFMIGGIVREFEANFRLGQGKYFVSEGDEYDTAFFDKESKFLHYLPEIAIITSIEFDHADIFSSIDDIKRAFRKFVTLLPPHGLIIANFDDPNVVEVVQSAQCPIVRYGVSSDHDWFIDNVHREGGYTVFSVFHNTVLWQNIAISVPGQHNCLNSLAVAIALNHIGVSPQDIAAGLKQFRGVKRRQEVRGIEWEVTVIDDFAHHPTAVRETLLALQQAYPHQRLVAVFEPRTNSSRRSIFQKDYVASFDHAELIILREPIPLSNLDTSELFSSKQLADDLINQRGKNAHSFSTTDEILNYLNQILRPGDVVAILSNGGFDNIHTRLLSLLADKNEK